jgi:predicted O-methyltransferase YrrM
MKFIDPALMKYCEEFTSPASHLLNEIERKTYLNTILPQMVSGHYQGRLLSMLSCMLRPRRILEVGTFTAYAALCLAEGLTDDGILHTIEVNDELKETIDFAIGQHPKASQYRLHIGSALAIIPTLKELWDLVFIDGAKLEYEEYYDLVIENMRPGGIIIADNVLWSGKILNSDPDKDTRAILAFNAKLNEDQRIEKVLLPIRDGLYIARKL